MSYYVTHDGSYFEYRMMIQTTRAENTVRLAAALRGLEKVREFQISPAGD